MLIRAALLLLVSLSCFPIPLPTPSVRIIAGGQVCEYPVNRMQAMPQSVIKTATTWNTEQAEFSGPSLSLLVAHCTPMAGVSALRVKARNGYAVDIPVADLHRFNPILAIRINRVLLPLNRRGPAWVVYPIDSFPNSLRNLETDGKMVWQVSSVEVLQ